MTAKSFKGVLPLVPAFAALVLFAGAHLRSARVQRAESLYYSFTQQLGRNEFDAARRSVEAADALSPDNAHYISDAGLLEERALRRGFDFERFREPALTPEEAARVGAAASRYERVLALNRFDDHACHNLGWLNWLLGRRDEARGYLRRAVEIDADVPLYHLSLGLLGEYVGEQETAHGEYAQALRISPSVIDSDFFRELRARRPEEAERLVSEFVSYFEEQVRRGAGPTAKAKLGKFYFDRDPARAAAVLREATDALPNLSRPWFSLGEWYTRQGDDAQAERGYRRALFIDGQDYTALAQLGKFYDERGRRDEAVSYLRRAVSSWLNQQTVHATRVRRIYVSRFTVRDDVIPRGLAAYTNPAFDLAGVSARLAALFRQVGDARSAEYYEKLAAGETP